MTALHKMVNGEKVPLTPEEIAEVEERESKAAEIMWEEVRRMRNSALAACDWTQLPDAPVDRAAWEVYRQELRDITTQENPFAIIWPVIPE